MYYGKWNAFKVSNGDNASASSKNHVYPLTPTNTFKFIYQEDTYTTRKLSNNDQFYVKKNYVWKLI